MVVAGYITPLSLVMPHHDHTVLPRQEVAVRLPRVPVFIELGRGSGGGGEKLKPQKYQEKCPQRTGGEDLGVSHDMQGPGSGDWDRQGGEIRGQGLSRKETRAREERHTEKKCPGGRREQSDQEGRKRE